jgi:hypothetical protein
MTVKDEEEKEENERYDEICRRVGKIIRSVIPISNLRNIFHRKGEGKNIQRKQRRR